jgi:hypothetical protein
MKTYVTYSELRARRRCPYRGMLEYDRRLSPIVKSPGLREGTIMDAGLNALYDHHKVTGGHSLDVMLAAIDTAAEEAEARIAAGAQLSEEEWAAIREKTQLLREIAANYGPWAREQDAGLRVITRQFQAEVPVLAPSGRGSTKYQFRFKPDGIVVKDGELWLWEDKAWKTIDRTSLKLLQMDEQCGMYLWGLRQLIGRGEAPEAVMREVALYGSPVGVIYNILRKKIPTIPALLQKGGTSKDKAIDTTEDVYYQTLLERGQDPVDYEEILNLLHEKGNTFFVRQPVYRNATELTEIGERIWQASRLVSEGHTFKCVDWTCAQCQFFAYCLEPSDELLNTAYRIREHQHEEYATEEDEVAA